MDKTLPVMSTFIGGWFEDSEDMSKNFHSESSSSSSNNNNIIII